VYRSYVNGGVGDRDRADILRAVIRAKRRNPVLGRAVFDFIRDTLLLKDPPSGPAAPEYRLAQRRFAGKFQQVTAPAMAKGFEDTALYVFNRLVSLNEVGGEPTKFGRSDAEVHAALKDRAAGHPGGMSPLSTHDTKRSEDVRARIDVLSERPAEWAARCRRWIALNRPHKIDVGDGQLAPDGNEEYLLYQTLVGAWPVEPLTAETRPAFVERIQAYMNKALHEAKVNTSWINPNTEYDAAVGEFVARILDPQAAGEFLADFEQFQKGIGRAGLVNGLAQTLVKVTAPGVPDTYQGTELWDFSLVDPDNRRPVDYERRATLLAALDRRAEADRTGLAKDLADQPEDGRIKLYVASRALRLRRDLPAPFAGDYVPLEVGGRRAGHVFCFVRSGGGDAVMVLVPRRIASLFGGREWEDTVLHLPSGLAVARWTDLHTGEDHLPVNSTLPVAPIFGQFPVGLLVGRRE
jgi:(1->4)-alpha-D-glucan 1-alpha-D-glucosylmutase